MTPVTSQVIDNVYDALTMMRLFSQRLSQGEISDNEASEMSWLLGSAQRRLEPVAGLLEEVQNQQGSRVEGMLDSIDEGCVQ